MDDFGILFWKKNLQYFEMPGGESHTHRALKRAAIFWAQAADFPCAGIEVRVPNGNFRADAAACSLKRKRIKLADGTTQSFLDPRHTVIFECKQSRPDFLKDIRSMTETRERIQELQLERDRLEAKLLKHYPTLRRGDSLFPEYDQHDLEQLDHPPYRQVLRELATLEKSIYGRTKFDRMVRYQCANLYYLVSIPGIFDPEELPRPWGLLIADPDHIDSDAPVLEEIRQPMLQEIPAECKTDLLIQISRAGTRETNKHQALGTEAIFETRRKRP